MNLQRITLLYKRLSELGDSDPMRGSLLLGLIQDAESKAIDKGMSQMEITAHVEAELEMKGDDIAQSAAA